MHSIPFSIKSLPPRVRVPAGYLAMSLLLAPWAIGPVSAQSMPPPPSAVANAPMVPPAAVMQKPLSPGAADTMSPQPSPQHVWVGGHWHWNGGQYGWVAGAWTLPPVENAVWIAPHWDSTGNGFTLAEGYWQQTTSTPMAVEAPPPPAPGPGPGPDVVMVNEAPPPPYQEIVVERDRPGRDYIWVGGYWSWSHGHHVWVGGHWDRPPHPGAVWIEPRWERRGNSYAFVQGFWREPGVSVGVSLGRYVGIGIAIGEPRHDEVIIREGPPAPRHEFHGPPPSPRHIWIAGYWAYHHNHNEWVEGHWELPPHERAVTG